MATRQVFVDEVFQLAVEKQKVFLRTAAIFLQCRQAEMDDNWCDPFGALLGEVDTTVELSLIIKEWRDDHKKTDRSEKAGNKAKG